MGVDFMLIKFNVVFNLQMYAPWNSSRLLP